MSQDKRQLPQGNYVGKIEDYGIFKKDDKASAFIKFKIDKGEGNGFAELTWFGGLANTKKEGAKKTPMEYTVTTLLDCGFSGADIADLATGPGNEVLKLGTEMALVVEDNLYNDELTTRIKYVNVLGAGGLKRATVEELAGKVDTSAFRAALLKGKENRPSTEDIGF